MIEIVPVLDIFLVEKMRLQYLKKPLDEKDSLSCHVCLRDSGKCYGVIRFYCRGEDIVIDCMATTSDATIEYQEMLLRSTIAMVIERAKECIIVRIDKPQILLPMQFTLQEGEYVANKMQIQFPSKCKKGE